jgi:hypothetical protein
MANTKIKSSVLTSPANLEMDTTDKLVGNADVRHECARA